MSFFKKGFGHFANFESNFSSGSNDFASSSNNVDESAKNLYKAMKGFGTDEKKIIREIVGHTNRERQLIKDRYLTMYGKKLTDDLKSEINGNFEEGVLALLEETNEYEAKCLKKAIRGIGTDEKTVIQILCPKEPHEIDALKETYRRLYNENLENTIAHEERGDLGRIFRSILTGGRSNSNYVDDQLANEEAKQLYKAGEGKFGTDETVFIRVLCTRSFAQLRATFAAYQQQTRHDIEQAVRSEFSGDMERACIAIVKAAKNKAAYFAERLNKAMKGAGTRDTAFIRILVSRSEIDLSEIKQIYRQIYGKNLKDEIKSELHGDYEDLFVALIDKC